MSSGAEHYREAERLIAQAQTSKHGAVARQETANLLAEAQVHATLALVAATEASNARGTGRGYRCVECGAMADTRGEHLTTCSIYVAPWAGTMPDDASGLTGEVTP